VISNPEDHRVPTLRREEIMTGFENLAKFILSASLSPRRIEGVCSALKEFEESMSFRDSWDDLGSDIELMTVIFALEVLARSELYVVRFFYQDELAGRLSRFLEYSIKLETHELMKGVMKQGTLFEKWDRILDVLDEMMYQPIHFRKSV
jgi:hypothetical protein